MNILVGCEYSGIGRDAFAKLGHNAWSCDLRPTEQEGQHIRMDIFFAILHPQLYVNADKWDLIICHPPCTALAVSGNRWYGNGQPRNAERFEAIRWTNSLWNTARNKADRVCFENPVGVLGQSPMGKATQYIQPWQFGHGETKKTGLWLSNLPMLEPTNIIDGREQRIWKMGPSPEREKLRSLTYQGIADGMAQQWGKP